ncbi:patatin-like phospholipase family protein [Halomicroarcula limicola]|uniref:Patatin-like phospholipase family protein n=1 Tax=Haloarcula limicola TaxID=1429915 RepID=A0A8J8C6X9_9EURY|nr:patatin-like phospholipase family protein [Halomicroarcula limicola]MBV0924463.1 patatin-like phospholipase family protein [Halomicroarcula limicola]
MSDEAESGSPDRSDDAPTRVAIACQGGGSHTAFTAGVLRALLADWDDRFDLVGISGTSGGAFNALAAWYGLLTDGPERARTLLASLWDELAATDPTDRAANDWITGIRRLEGAGFPLPHVTPYQIPGPETGKDRIRGILERHIDFGAVPDLCTADAPELVVGTVNVNEGYFETFTNEEVTVDAVLASAAVPDLFEAVEIHGHLHWDGLFSQNPPINDLMHVPPARKPEELWIVQINPQTFEGEPRSAEAIADRRNQLSGNLSLNQELRFIERVNEWVEDGTLPEGQFTHTAVRRIQLGKQLRSATKVDRSPRFVEELRRLGRKRAETFLADHPRREP